MRILLVEDSCTMRGIEKSILAKLGHTEITEACNGNEGLSKIKTDCPDLILVNWNMPGMDGPTLVMKIREKYTEVPIIMVTAEAGESRVVQALQAGANDYIAKPFTVENFEQKIKQAMSTVRDVISLRTTGDSLA